MRDGAAEKISSESLLTTNTMAPAFEYPTESIISYAQTHEDVLLWRALHRIQSGFYIDVGAHDPVVCSVTKAFYDRGWNGINVEPTPTYAAKLRKERPRDETFEVALGQTPGIATIYDLGDTGLSTLVKGIAEAHATAGIKATTQNRVPVTTLAALLDGLGDREVHFLKIDVEGYEQQVLAGANFQKARPWIVLVDAVKPRSSIPTHEVWEPLLLEAGYVFAYFDGLNRFYVAREHLDLKRCFSVPVSTCDLFRDYDVVRLSEALAALEQDKRDRMKHEVPRLGGGTHACDFRDADGLLRIVGMQASDLARLRRALLSLRPQEFEISEWVRSTALAELARLQDAITDGIERSRWRHLGLRLGLTKQSSWEAGSWQTDLIRATDESNPNGDGWVGALPVAKLLLELERLNGLLDTFRRSRWRKLGQWLGLAKRLPWESSLWRHSLLIKPFPEAAGQGLSGGVRSEASRSSYEGMIKFTTRRFLQECREFATDAILDIGANCGQFGQAIRNQGYHGHIVSFEPLSHAHAALVVAASADPLWDVAERCAVGATVGSAEINIAGNSFSSSLLPMLDLHREAAPQSEYLGKEHCAVITLDDFIDRTFSDPTTLFGIKIDTQGYEAEVLAGLKRNHDMVRVILCEMCVAPLYAHGATMDELCQLLAQLNYRCVALGPEFEDPRTGELLAVNGVFVKRS